MVIIGTAMEDRLDGVGTRTIISRIQIKNQDEKFHLQENKKNETT